LTSTGRTKVALSIAAICPAIAGWSAAGHAAVVNVQLNSDIGDYTGQGALTTADAHIWNHVFIPAPTSYVDSTGAATSVTVSVSSDFFYTPGSWTGNNLLDQIQSEYFGDTGTFTIGGLNTNARYNLYLYGWDQEGFQNSPTSFGGTFHITSGGGSNTNPQTTSGAELVSGTDYTSSTIATSALGKAYVVYMGLIPNTSGQITGTFGSSTQGGNFNGFQLQGGATGGVGVPIVSFTATGPVDKYGNQITNGTGTEKGTFTPNSPTPNALNVVGSHGSYQVASVTSINGTAGAGDDSVEATGFSTGDKEIFAVDVLVNGTQANATQIATLVSSIDNGDSDTPASSVVASATLPVPDPFGSQYNLFINATDVGGGTDWLGLNLNNDTNNLVGYTFSAVAVVPEPMTGGALLGLGGVGLMARRRRRSS
jgi:hypothetical protein